MHRFQLLSVTAQTINAQLFENERIIQDKDGVGLYDGCAARLVYISYYETN